MIRFVDLTAAYWTDEQGAPCCAFLDTTHDMFIMHNDAHVCHGPEDVEPYGDRCAGLVPEGFWIGRSDARTT